MIAFALANLFFFSILSPSTWYPLIWFTTNWDPHFTLKDVTPTHRARRRPVMMASYSVSMFVVLNIETREYRSASFPFSGVRTRLAPDLSLEEDPYICSSQVSSTFTIFLMCDTSFTWGPIDSTIKLARAFPFTAIRGANIIRNSLYSMTHFEASEFCKKYFNGWLVRTMTLCALK